VMLPMNCNIWYHSSPVFTELYLLHPYFPIMVVFPWTQVCSLIMLICCCCFKLHIIGEKSISIFYLILFSVTIFHNYLFPYSTSFLNIGTWEICVMFIAGSPLPILLPGIQKYSATIFCLDRTWAGLTCHPSKSGS
jgi:hypothetical protein